MDNFGEILKKHRKAKKLPLRTVAKDLKIDQAILSKVECGIRLATREQVVKFANYYAINEDELLVSWLSDRLIYEVADEENALKAIQVAEEKVQYFAKKKTKPADIIQTIVNTLKNDGRVATAWLFGSMARGEENKNSDIDLMVQMNDVKKYSMFDLMDIAYITEKAIKIKVDLVEKGYLKDFANSSAEKDMIKIYG